MSLRRVLCSRSLAACVAGQTRPATLQQALHHTLEPESAAAVVAQPAVSNSLDDPHFPREFGRVFKSALAINDGQTVEILWLGLLRIGLQPERWMYYTRLLMHTRRKSFPDAVVAFEDLKHSPYPLCSGSYHAMLRAYSQAGQEPYEISPDIAFAAEGLFQEMKQSGHKVDVTICNILMLTQSRAVLPDKALNTYKQLLKNHLTPDHHTISTLIHAYSKAKQPWKAQEIFDTLFALHNIEPDVIAWNGLLGAFALAGHKDATYAVWQRMLEAGVIPDEISQRNLAVAFQDNPQMASDLVHEAKQIQDAAQRPEGERSVQRVRGGQFAEQLNEQIHAVQMGIDSKGWAFLDLHGLSVAATGLALHNRLQYIVSQPDLVMNATDYTGLEIVTGVGRHTHASRTFVLKSAVKQVLRQRHLQSVQGSNAGVVRVPLPSLQRYVQRELRQNLLLGFFQGAGWRYLTLFGGICSAVSAVVVIPKLLMVA